jgi:hypothetical protein
MAQHSLLLMGVVVLTEVPLLQIMDRYENYVSIKFETYTGAFRHLPMDKTIQGNLHKVMLPKPLNNLLHLAVNRCVRLSSYVEYFFE